MRSKSPHDKQHNQDNQDDADDADTPVTIAISIPANDAAKATKQKYDKDDDKY
jgi:hypothetical protein